MNKNKEKLIRSFEGCIVARVYDEENNLVEVHRAENTLTIGGLNRLVDMILDGFNQTTPKAYGNKNSTDWQMSTLHGNEFDGSGHDGEIFGVCVANWPAKSKSTFYRTDNGYSNDSYVLNMDYMFNNNRFLYSNFHNTNISQYWSPSPSNNFQGGWVADLGVTEVVDEIFTAADITNYYNLEKKSLNANGILVKDITGTITYSDGDDYLWDCGDGETYGSIKLLNSELIDASLKVSYTWHDIPHVPIVGFSIDAGGNSGWTLNSFFNAFGWSLNQGESRTSPFFPYNNGNPTKVGWEGYKQGYYYNGAWRAEAGQSSPTTYFMSSFPYAVKNPVQLSWFGQCYDNDKYISNFDLLTVKYPKLGVHAIGLGTGSGTPSSGDTSLFNLSLKNITTSKTRSGSEQLLIRACLDYSEGNDETFTEAGLFYTDNDSVYFKEDVFWNGSTEEAGAGLHSEYIKGSNKIVKLSPLEAGDFEQLASHAMFDVPWSKDSSKRVDLVYEINITW